MLIYILIDNTNTKSKNYKINEKIKKKINKNNNKNIKTV